MGEGGKKTRKGTQNKEEPVNSDFETNQELISTAFFSYVSKTGKMPSLGKLAIESGLSQTIIENHLKQSPNLNMESKLLAFHDMMLVQFAQKVSKSSNPKLWQMYFRLVNPNFGKRVK